MTPLFQWLSDPARTEITEFTRHQQTGIPTIVNGLSQKNIPAVVHSYLNQFRVFILVNSTSFPPTLAAPTFSEWSPKMQLKTARFWATWKGLLKRCSQAAQHLKILFLQRKNAAQYLKIKITFYIISLYTALDNIDKIVET